MQGTARATRRHGGRHLSRFERDWTGLSLELSRWEANPAGHGFCGLTDHVLFVTLAGATSRTEASIEGGQRYDGADFPTAN